MARERCPTCQAVLVTVTIDDLELLTCPKPACPQPSRRAHEPRLFDDEDRGGG